MINRLTDVVGRNRMRRSRLGSRRMIGILAGIGVLVAGSCGTALAANSKSSSRTTLTTLNIGDVPFYANAALALGEQKGIFAHYGLKVNLQTASNVNVILADLHSGQQQLGFGTTPLILNADEAGQNVKCVAPLGPTNESNPTYPENAVVVAKNSKITSLKQLAGQTVGLNQLAGSNQLYLQVGVGMAGGSFSSVKLATIPFADMNAAINSGSIQAGFEVPPYIAAGEKAGQTKVLADLDDVTAPWTDECYVATTSYINANKSVIDRFVEAQDQSILYAAAHPSQADAEVATVSGLPAAEVKTSVPPEIMYTDDLAPSSLVLYENLMSKYKALTGGHLSAAQVAYVAPKTPMKTLEFNGAGKFTGGS
jgi:NitT/TauT family transport system substrate-binding protein